MRPVALPKMMANYLDRVTNSALQAGQVIRQMDGSYHYIDYINSSGAYAVPLTGINKEISGSVVQFTAGGRSISVHSAVEVIHPLAMGGSSPEYKRYVTMAKKSKARSNAAGNSEGAALVDQIERSAPLGEFDSTPLSPESEAAEGHLAELASQQPTVKAGKGMAKKAKAAKSNGAARSAKPAKTVRACACGCGGQTTGYFMPGHDARLHGWISKLADGRIDPKEIPASTRKALELQQTKSGYRAMKPHFYKV